MELEYKSKYYYTDYTKKYNEKGTFYNVAEKPTFVVLKPTLNCIANCKHCNPRSKKFSTNKKMSLLEYDKLLKKLKAMGTEQVCISGGEPLIYKDIVKLVRLITKNGLKVSLNTNGWFLDLNMFKELMDAGLLCINLSIDSPKAEEHDKLRALNGLFDKAINQIRECKESNIPFKLNLRMVLSKYNYKEISEMIDLATSIKADILSIDMIEADSQNKYFLLNSDQINDFKNNYVPKLIEKIQKLNIKENLKFYNIKQLNDFFNTKFNDIKNFENGIYWPDDTIKRKCDIPSSFMIIEGDGMVLPCNAVEYNREKIIGNVLDTDVEELWKSKEWNNFRNKKMDFCRECPMNMSYMIVFNEDTIKRESEVEKFSTERIKNMIKINEKKDYYEERKEEYLNFFNKENKFIDEINIKYPIDSLEYKTQFLYPSFFEKMDSNETIFDSYSEASEYYSLRQLLGRPEKFENQLEIFDFMEENLSKNSIVMDYGCCVGDFSILFAKMGFKVLSIDLDIDTFKFAENRFKNRNLDIACYSILKDMKLPKLSQKVNFVFCRDVLEHTVNPIEVLTFFYDNLADDGYMYISTMNPGEEIYIGAEHLENTIKKAQSEEYREFFEKHFISLGLHGLYKKNLGDKNER